MILLNKFGTPTRDDDQGGAPALLNYHIRNGDALICLETEEGSEKGELSAYERGECIGVCYVEIEDEVITSRNVDVFPVIAGMIW